MKTEQVTGSISEYQGKSLDNYDLSKLTFPTDGTLAIKLDKSNGKAVINYSDEVKVYESVAELKGSEDYPSDSEILKIVNAKQKANTRSAANQKAVASLKAQYESTEEFADKQMLDSIIALAKAQGKVLTDAQAREKLEVMKSL